MPSEYYGSYELIERLATGGMAQIFLARPRGMDGFKGYLVVKRILPHLAENEEFVRMFLDEARIAARLNHPNIVQIFDLGAQEDTYFIAMEHIPGEDLRRVTRRATKKGVRLPIALACLIMMEACEGLDYAHRKKDPNGRPLGIVHRDISPQNIVVTFQGGVKVVDFGIAQAVDQATVTRSGVLKGKYSYMSPEQASARPVDSRSDIFALGVVLYELLTGSRLFKRPNDIQTLNAVIECKVSAPSLANPALSPDLDVIVLKALAKQPENRYAQAGQLKAALQGWLTAQGLTPSKEELTQYMQRLYADRLVQEKVESVPEEMDSLPSKRRKAGSQSRSKPEASAKLAAELSDRQDEEATHAEPPEFPPFPVPRHTRDLPQYEPWDDPPTGTPQRERPKGWRSDEQTRTRMPTRMVSARERLQGARAAVSAALRSSGQIGFAGIAWAGRRVWRARIWIASLVLLAGLGLGARQLSQRVSLRELFPRRTEVTEPAAVRPPARPSVQVTTDPAGAEVWLDGSLQANHPTPMTLPPLRAGSHLLEMKKAGFVAVRITFQVPEQGEWNLPTFRLEPKPRGGGMGNAMAVSVEVESDPSGADLFVDGVGQGKTPQTFQASPRSVLALRFERRGYAPLVRRIQVGDDQHQTEVVGLTPLAKGRSE